MKGTLVGVGEGHEKTNVGARNRVQLTMSPSSTHHLAQSSQYRLQLLAPYLPRHDWSRAQKTLRGYLATCCSIWQMRKETEAGSLRTLPSSLLPGASVGAVWSSQTGFEPRVCHLFNPVIMETVLLTLSALASLSIKWV